MEKIEVYTNKVPEPIGPYSQAIITGNTVYVSGQIPVDAATGEVVSGLVDEQAYKVMENLRAVLEEAGTDLNHVVKTVIYLKDMKDFGKVNEIYSRYFEKPYPARATVEISSLPKNVLVEIEAIAIINNK